jgi:hypothetical protein
MAQSDTEITGRSLADPSAVDCGAALVSAVIRRAAIAA